jgi:endoglucanase
MPESSATPVSAFVVADDVSVAELPLLTDKLNLGAYDPEQRLTGLSLNIEHWYVRQDAPELLAGILAHARNRRTPLVTIEPFPAANQHTPVLDRVLAGQADDELRRLADVARDSAPQTVLARWGHEMDLSGLYPWSANDPYMYRAAYRHVVAVFNAEGANNVRWVWSPAGEASAPAFYPGGDVVDYVGLTVLGDTNWDAGFGLPRQSLADLLAPRYSVVQGLGKPIIVAELGVSGTAAEQRAWLAAGSEALSDFPLVQALVYFNDRNAPNNRRLPEPDWRLVDQEALAGLLDNAL